MKKTFHRSSVHLGKESAPEIAEEIKPFSQSDLNIEHNKREITNTTKCGNSHKMDELRSIRIFPNRFANGICANVRAYDSELFRQSCLISFSD
ncbi:hypothetical protein DLM75_23465 [Leptospira stimsonii]|uniref:Uncharacterized protein n=1 Tax=Leptospira stimsonii TaxID=2202203 RepID=A0A396YMF8_9LEPT|nr:hypothetical protein DLM75_23465 [Leptospira stimsonii]